jgi:RNA polymerase sigma-70 factor (ECF subfamily)
MRVGLTLKAVCGFSVGEIARAFLAKPDAIAQRLVRAKARIKDLGLCFEMPAPEAFAERMPAVLRTIYLLFNEGYLASGGDAAIRADICAEAVRLARLVADHAETSSPTAHAVAALLALQHARAKARTAPDGSLVLLEHQDRALWDRDLIALGFAHLRSAQGGALLTSYHLEAGIASVHAHAPSWPVTDWRRLLHYYDLLTDVAPSSIVALNRAVVVAMIEGADAALEAIAGLGAEPNMKLYPPYHLTVGDLQLKRGNRTDARAAYEAALALPVSEPERRLIAEKLKRCADA